MKKDKFHRQITIRNTILILTLFIIPGLLLFFVVNNQVSSLIKNQVYNQLSDLVEENIKSINIFLEDRKNDLKAYSKFEVDTIEEIKIYQEIFSSLIERKQWYDLILISDLQGDIFLSINQEIETNISIRDYFNASSQGQFYYSGIFYSDILDKPAMIISYPLLNRKDKIIGVLAASINLNLFYNLLFDLSGLKTGELFLIDTEGIFLSPTKLGGKPLSDKAYAEGETNPHTGIEGIKSHLDYRGKQVLCAYKKLPESDIYLVSEIDLEEALLPVQKVNRMILYVFLPFFFLITVISILASNRITVLIKRLTRDLKSTLLEARAKKREVDAVNLELEFKIKESERLAQEVKASEEYIYSLIESFSLGVLAMDSALTISHFNKEFKNIFGTIDIKKGQNAVEIIPWLKNPDIQNALNQSITLKSTQRLYFIELDHKKDEIYFNLSFFPIIDINNDVTGVTLLVEDATERKRLRDQLAEYEKLSALSQLALGAAHEINNPLLGISSYLELIKEKTDSSQEKEEIDIVLENVYRISETIRGLLNFARPTPPQFTKVNLISLIEETLSFISRQPIFRKINIEKKLSSSLPQITADLNQIRQILINMFINAAQAMPEGGTLSVETSKVKFEEKVQINISDTGIGIPRENLNKIFNPFFTTKKSMGTGLGLSISQSYINNHNGSIYVRSEENKGTTISIILPIRQKGKTLKSGEEIIS